MHMPVARLRAATAKFGVFAALSFSSITAIARAESSPGAVYAMTNATSNSIAVYDRGHSGVLSPAGTYLTNGQGTGAGLGSQGAIALSDDGRWLVAVNAASNDVSVFSVKENGLLYRGKAPSGGQTPVSVTIYDDLVFVVNSGGTPNITGFRLDKKNGLTMIPGSTLPLSGQAPAQISFSNDGDLLAVTLKNTNSIDIFRVNDSVASGPATMPSSGQTPFGFSFDKRDHLVVSEAFGGAPSSSGISSYNLAEDGHLNVATGSLKSGQTSACWVAITHNAKFAYVANATSADITGLSVARSGMLTLLSPDGISASAGAGSSLTDLTITPNDRFLYVLNAGAKTIGAYRIASDGSLGSLGEVAGLPAGAVGLAAR